MRRRNFAAALLVLAPLTVATAACGGDDDSDEENQQHLQLLARLARMLDDADFRQRLLEAPGGELFELLSQRDEELAAS